jgi:hypothetical protein
MALKEGNPRYFPELNPLTPGVFWIRQVRHEGENPPMLTVPSSVNLAIQDDIVAAADTQVALAILGLRSYDGGPYGYFSPDMAAFERECARDFAERLEFLHENERYYQDIFEEKVLRKLHGARYSIDRKTKRIANLGYQFGARSALTRLQNGEPAQIPFSFVTDPEISSLSDDERSILESCANFCEWEALQSAKVDGFGTPNPFETALDLISNGYVGIEVGKGRTGHETFFIRKQNFGQADVTSARKVSRKSA